LLRYQGKFSFRNSGCLLEQAWNYQCAYHSNPIRQKFTPATISFTIYNNLIRTTGNAQGSMLSKSIFFTEQVQKHLDLSTRVCYCCSRLSHLCQLGDLGRMGLKIKSDNYLNGSLTAIYLHLPQLQRKNEQKHAKPESKFTRCIENLESQWTI
jgi:hypothetical protein